QFFRTFKEPAIDEKLFAFCFHQIFRASNSTRCAEKSYFCHKRGILRSFRTSPSRFFRNAPHVETRCTLFSRLRSCASNEPMLSFPNKNQMPKKLALASVPLALIFVFPRSFHAQKPTPAVTPHRNVIIFVADGLRNGSVNETDAPTLSMIR